MTIQDSSSTNHSKAALLEKRLYSAPKLTNYGHVTILTQGGSPSLTSDSGNNAMSPFVSDRRMKTNIIAIGVHPLGIPLYLYDYKDDYKSSCGYGKFLGVMADEVEVKLPEAVHIHEDGYKVVDYGVLALASIH